MVPDWFLVEINVARVCLPILVVPRAPGPQRERGRGRMRAPEVLRGWEPLPLAETEPVLELRDSPAHES